LLGAHSYLEEDDFLGGVHGLRRRLLGGSKRGGSWSITLELKKLYKVT
jgi:hypothetical protein